MNWKRLEQQFMTTRSWVKTLDHRPEGISPARWRAMQTQLANDREQDHIGKHFEDDDLVFWLHEAVKQA
jgi:hypothetical protein